MIKVAIDTLPLESGHAARGMGMYTRNLIKHLEEEAKNDRTINIDAISFKENKPELKNYDIVHYPYFDLFWHTLPIKKPSKSVVTIPDVIPLLYPVYYPPGLKGGLNLNLQKIALKNINRIITISETSKKDIIRHLGIAPDKIDTTYLAPNFKVKKSNIKSLQNISKKFDLPKDFILYVGDVNWNKNIIRLCQAAVSLKKVLVIVGKQATSGDYDNTHIENAPLKELQSKFSESKYIKTLGFVENDELNAIWQLASVYCQPSLYEGFGLPVLEAMDARVPVVASKTNAIVEVASDAALFFDPYDVLDMINKLKTVINNSKVRSELIKKGNKRVKEFSWKNTARETINTYKKTHEL